MGVSIDPRRDPHQDAWANRTVGDQRSDPVDLDERVDDDSPHAGIERCCDLLHRLVVAVEHESVRRDTRMERHVHLAAGGNVEIHPFVMGESCHGRREKRLGRVCNPVAERHHRFTAPQPKLLLVVDEQWSPVFRSEFEHVDGADGESPDDNGGRVGEKVARDGGHAATPWPGDRRQATGNRQTPFLFLALGARWPEGSEGALGGRTATTRSVVDAPLRRRCAPPRPPFLRQGGHVIFARDHSRTVARRLSPVARRLNITSSPGLRSPAYRATGSTLGGLDLRGRAMMPGGSGPLRAGCGMPRRSG